MDTADTRQRTDLVHRAFVLEWLTLAWVLVETAGGIFSGLQAHSISLTAFGIDGAIEAISASVLLWRLNVELQHGRHFSETAERQASRIGGGLLFALAAYVVVAAAWSLWVGRGEEFSVLGMALTTRQRRSRLCIFWLGRNLRYPARLEVAHYGQMRWSR